MKTTTLVLNAFVVNLSKPWLTSNTLLGLVYQTSGIAGFQSVAAFADIPLARFVGVNEVERGEAFLALGSIMCDTLGFSGRVAIIAFALILDTASLNFVESSATGDTDLCFILNARGSRGSNTT